MTTDAASAIATLLLVEDDEELRAEMALYLRDNGYRVQEAGDAKAGRRLLALGGVEAIVLDVNLPGEDGLSFCRHVADESGPPMLILSAMGESVDRILGLELGADDYVVKPIPPRELLARIKALLRRRPATPAGQGTLKAYRFGGFRLDLAARHLRAPNGTILLLTRSEMSILQMLLERPQVVVPREDLMGLLRAHSRDNTSRSVDLHISRLRRKIQDQTRDEIIKTYRGFGYLLDTPVVVE